QTVRCVPGLGAWATRRQEGLMFPRSVMILAVTVAATASVSAARAADLPAPVQPFYSPTPVMNWTGFYLGVHGGGGWGDQNPNTPAVFSLAGPYVGAQAGYNW